MPEDLATTWVFIMGTKHRERVVAGPGLKGQTVRGKGRQIRAHPGNIRQEDPGRYGREKASSSRMTGIWCLTEAARRS